MSLLSTGDRVGEWIVDRCRGRANGRVAERGSGEEAAAEGEPRGG